MHHRVATGLHMAHNQMMAHAGMISDSIEMRNLQSPRGAIHRPVDQEDSIKTTSTLSPNTCSSGRDTLETNLSLMTRDDTSEKDENVYKRSRSYHGKGSVVSISL